MRELKVVYNGIKPIACGTSASGQIGTFRAVFSFSPDWDAYPERTAVFVANSEPIGILLDKDNSCEIHKEITKNAGRILVGAFGVGMDANGRAVRYPGEYTCTNISEGASADVEDPTPQEVTLYEKMLARIAQAETEAQEATENANNAADNANSAADRANEAADRAEQVNPNGAVQSVNGKTGAVQLTASDVNALPKDTPIPAKTSDIENDSGYITAAVNALLNYYLKSETYSRTEVDGFISGLESRLNAIADSDDKTLDQLSEIVAYIKSNKSLIDSITTSKVSVSDIVDNLTTSAANKPLSAKQGATLKQFIDTLMDEKLSASALPAAINTALAQAAASGEFDGAPGKTPERGTDYWTPDDRAAMVQDVLAALPTWEGGSY